MNTTWDASTRRTVAIILFVFLVFVIYIMRPVLPFLVTAGLIAFILAPIVNFFQDRLRFPKALAILIAYLFLFIVLLLIPIIVIPALVNAFADITFDPVAVIRMARNWLVHNLEAYRAVEAFGLTHDLSFIVDPALDYLNEISLERVVPSFDAIINTLPSTIELTWGVAASLFDRVTSVFFAVLLTLLYSVYLSAGAANMREGLFRLVPEAYKPEFTRLGGRVQRVWSAYLRGQLTLGIIIWLVTWIVGVTIGLPGAFALGVIAGVMEMIPNLGPILAAIPAMLVALLQGSQTLPVTNLTFVIIVIIAYSLIQQFENNLVVPKVLGSAVELSPLVVMVGVVVGFSVGGILGALLAAPVIASTREFLMYVYAKVLGQDPFSREEEIVIVKVSFWQRLRDLWTKMVLLWQEYSRRWLTFDDKS